MNAIFSVFHKDYVVPNNKLIYPILVGNKKDDICLKTKKQIFRDDIGDNIAELNPFFCELTAQYWIWKNFKQEPDEIVGLAHYRRYLIKDHPTLSTYDKVKIKINNFIDKDILNLYLPNGSYIQKILGNQKVILPKKISFFNENGNSLSVEMQYFESHVKSDWKLVESIISEKTPEYLEAFNKYKEQNTTFIGNMFITTRSVFDRYCEWLFPLLFEFYSRTSIQEDSYQSRSVGFIAERLLNVYVLKNLREDEISCMNLSFSY